MYKVTNRSLVFLIAAVIVAVAGCSKSRSDNSNTPQGGRIEVSSNSNAAPSSSVVAPSSTEDGKPTTWEANASSLNGSNGQTFTLTCSPGGREYSVWGSDIYTSDSSICTAGVHSGLISYERGGTVTIELLAGRSLYGCSARNGVTSSAYGPYPQSFVFKTADMEAIIREADEQTPVLWNTSAAIVPFQVGKTVKLKCPAMTGASSVWGTDIYTTDSSICNAAVHAGKLKMESGGPVTIELRAGQSEYKGSTRNGVTTSDYAKYPNSFVVK